ncbi:MULTISPECIES: glycoside hydrolase family 16 protein [Nocardioides]|uniref:glycoside hydrolase family 16 protein n=1 Tax=Nocardioides TaxID=1839 RepID=UPI001A8E0DD5|nr:MULTISPECIES: glycoside hydrolase family 16 protein [Nocardioides]
MALVSSLVVHATTEDEPDPTSGSASTSGSAQDPWTLLWSDDFEGDAGTPPNGEYWSHEIGGSGWGNEELQYYTDSADNAALDGEGHLVITAREVDPATTDLKCWYGPCTVTSARLITAGKQKFTYGRIESRVKVPAGSGSWPALWMLGADFGEVGWPQTGEIDIMEFVGREPDQVFGTIHGPGYAGGESFNGFLDIGRPVAEDWHEFTVEWSPQKIVWAVDGAAFHQASPTDVAPHEWVFDHPFFLLANLAVGGNFGGALAADVVFPVSFTIDHVRVYRASGDPS